MLATHGNIPRRPPPLACSPTAVASLVAHFALFPIRPLTNPRALHPRAPHPITRQVFDGSKSTEDVYNTVGKPLVDSVIQGIHGTLFAYGQTGSGKTFSMTGQRAEAKRGRSQKEVPGIVQLAANDLFAHIRNTASSGGAGKESKEDAEEDLEKDAEDAEEGKEEAVKAIGGSATDGDTVSFKVVASFVEIYNENIRVRFLPLPRPHHTRARTPYSLGSRSPVLGVPEPTASAWSLRPPPPHVFVVLSSARSFGLRHPHSSSPTLAPLLTRHHLHSSPSSLTPIPTRPHPHPPALLLRTYSTARRRTSSSKRKGALCAWFATRRKSPTRTR